MRRRRGIIFRWTPLALGCALLSAGCERNDMHNQPRHEPAEKSTFFPDGQANRPKPEGTLARGELIGEKGHLYTGKINGEEATTYPFAITLLDLERGKQRFEIYCSMCHGATGMGDGMIVQRGFIPPPSFLSQRLIDAPPGHYFNVMTNGWGAMYNYADRISPEDRWRIAAYVQTLQLSQRTQLTALPADEQAKYADAIAEMNKPKETKPEGAHHE